MLLFHKEYNSLPMNNAVHIENESDVSGYIREEGLFLVQDGIEKKFLSILNDLSQPTFLQKMVS